MLGWFRITIKVGVTCIKFFVVSSKRGVCEVGGIICKGCPIYETGYVFDILHRPDAGSEFHTSITRGVVEGRVKRLARGSEDIPNARIGLIKFVPGSQVKSLGWSGERGSLSVDHHNIPVSVSPYIPPDEGGSAFLARINNPCRVS